MRHATVLALLLVGCGGKLQLDAATVNDHLDHIDANVPMCHSAVVAPSAMRVAGQELRHLTEAVRADRSNLRAAPPRYRSAGSCGGDLTATSQHENGITDYTAIFTAFCVQSAEGDVVIDGTVLAHEVGTPSDAGPIVASLDTATSGPLVVAQNGATMEITLVGAHTQYGIPAAWAPAAPDADHPDVLTVDNLSATYPADNNREDYVRDIRIERVGDAQAVITVVNGKAGTTGEGHVDVRTLPDDPVVFDFT